MRCLRVHDCSAMCGFDIKSHFDRHCPTFRNQKITKIKSKGIGRTHLPEYNDGKPVALPERHAITAPES